jgi:hypothetical protein
MGWRGRNFRRKGVGLPWIPGRTDFGLRREKEKGFQILIQGNGIEIKSFEYFQTKFELDSK